MNLPYQDPALPQAQPTDEDLVDFQSPVEDMPAGMPVPEKPSKGMSFDFSVIDVQTQEDYDALPPVLKQLRHEIVEYGKLPSPEQAAAMVDKIQTRLDAINSPQAQAAKAQAEREALGKPLTSTEINDITALKGVSTSLDILEQKLAAVSKSDRGPLAGRMAGMDPYNKEAREVENIITSIVPGLARGVFGEVGVLTNEDVQRYTKLLPNLNTPPEIAAANLANLRDKLESSKIEKFETLQKAGMNISGFMDEYKSLVETRALKKERGHTNPNDPYHVGKRYKDAAGNVRTYKGNSVWE